MSAFAKYHTDHKSFHVENGSLYVHCPAWRTIQITATVGKNRSQKSREIWV
jgi:hypothetical protein